MLKPLLVKANFYAVWASLSQGVETLGPIMHGRFSTHIIWWERAFEPPPPHNVVSYETTIMKLS